MSIINQIIAEFKTLDLTQNPSLETIEFDDTDYACHKVVYLGSDEKQNLFIVDQSLNHLVKIDETLYCDSHQCLRLLVHNGKRYVLNCQFEGNHLTVI